MRCPSPCWTPMDPSGDRLTHTCPSCGKVCTLRDTGYIPAPGYTPSPLRVPADPFKELPEEMGWSQPPEGVVLDVEETPREKAQRERRERESGLTQMERDHRLAIRMDTARTDAATRRRGEFSARSRAWRAA